mgnify:CR=1 FL=1
MVRALREYLRPQQWERSDENNYSLVVNATGTVKPTKSVQIGSFVSGPIKDLFVEFNQEVKANDLLATIDPRLFADAQPGFLVEMRFAHA